MAAPSVNAQRLWDRLMTLGAIGATAVGGVDRQALSAGEIAAWRQVIAWAEAHGLCAATDAAGNLFLRLPGWQPELAPVMTGSHLDTQPNGGMFDGALGVLAGLEVAAALAEARHSPRRDLLVVSWMNEEGSRFAPGMMGSEFFLGARTLDEILAVQDSAGNTAGAALAMLHEAYPGLPRIATPFPVHSFVELHIEQAPLLEEAATPIGVVTGIQGKKTWTVTLTGRAGHAGTAPMSERQDALAAMARILTAAYEEIGFTDALVKFTVGRVHLEPNAPSVVPSRVRFSVDLRHPETAKLRTLGELFEALCHAHARPCSLEMATLVDVPSISFDAGIQTLIADAARIQGYASMPLLSAAGHDSRQLALLCQTGMIFIPCRNGVSHAPEEWANFEDVSAGVSVLAQVIGNLLEAT